MALAGSVLPAHADAASPYLWYRITTQASLAFDVSGGSTSWGAPVIQWDLNTGSNQWWQLQPVGSGPNEYQLVNANSGQCLSIDSDGSVYDGAPLIQFPCDGAVTQQWYFQATWILGGLEYTIASAIDTDYVIDVPGSTANLGVQLEIWQKHQSGGLNQAFFITTQNR